MKKFEDFLSPQRFVGLHAHSGFSTFDGLGHPSKHIDFLTSEQQGMDAWALTDHGNGNGLAHAYSHFSKLNKKGIKYRQLYGVEFYFVPSLDGWRVDYEGHKQEIKDARSNRQKLKKILESTDIDADEESAGGLIIENEDETKSFDVNKDEWKRRYHLVVLAKNRVGLSNLFTLVKKSYKDGFYRFPRIDFNLLNQHSEGLIVSTACIGGIYSNKILRGRSQGKSEEEIVKELLNLTDRFTDCVGVENFFLELQFNSLEAQHHVNEYLFKCAEKSSVKLIATADSHYPMPDQWESRELYRRLGWMKKEIKPLPKFEDLKCELYPKNAEQMWAEFGRHHGSYDFYRGKEEIVREAIERTHDIAWEMCTDTWIDMDAKLPNFSTSKISAFSQLATIVKEKLVENNLDKEPAYVDRAKEELQVIKLKGFENYFLTMYKIFNEAKKRTLLGPGRGSGAGSLVNYLLELTQLDPIKYDLLFERFINLGRAGFPDIDTDAGDRDVLIDVSRELFGEENVLPVSNFNTLKLKSLIKDIGKFYGVPFEDVNTVTSRLSREVTPHAKADDVEKSYFMLKHDDCLRYSKTYSSFMERYTDVSKHVEGLFLENRSIGRHAGGVLICPNLEKHMPVISVRGELQTPWAEGLSYRNLEDNGFLKFDFLGLSLLKMVEDCIRLILKNKSGTVPSFDEIKKFFDDNVNCRFHDLDDQKVFKYVYHEGRFPAIFQFTNTGARRFCMQSKPTSIEEIGTITAIYRPGPLRANVDKKYVNDKNNPETVKYDHPIIKEILESTYGHITFQEQFMKLAQKLSGFTPEESDKMRKTLVKKTHSTADGVEQAHADLRERFVTGAESLNGISREISESLFEKIKYFCAYGFNKSHAISYAVDSYYAAWLMTHHEKEWLATCLQTEMQSPDGLSKIISEIKQLGYNVLPADINESEDVWVFSDQKNSFVAPLSAVKGIGEKAVEEIMENRPYYSLDDLFYTDDGTWKHSKMNKTCLTSLCKIGALSNLYELKEKIVDNHRQIYLMISENYEIIKKGRHGITKTQFKRMQKSGESTKPIIDSLISKYVGEGDWSRSEKIDLSFEYSCMVANNLLFSDNVLEKLKETQVPPMSSLKGGDRGIVWFCISELIPRVSKNGKVFYRAKTVDDNNNVQWLRIWGDSNKLEKYTMWMADVSNDPNWGCSSSVSKIRRIPTGRVN